MDLTNLRNDMGFIDRERILLKMSRLTPERDDYFCLYMSEESFATLGVVHHGVAIAPIFEIYAGNFDLYNFIGDLIEGICKQLNARCSIKEYRGRMPD